MTLQFLFLSIFNIPEIKNLHQKATFHLEGGFLVRGLPIIQMHSPLHHLPNTREYNIQDVQCVCIHGQSVHLQNH